MPQCKGEKWLGAKILAEDLGTSRFGKTTFKVVAFHNKMF